MAGEWGQVAQPLQAHTADLDEALALVSSVYCSHRLQLAAQQRQVNTRLQVAPAYRSSLVSLAYGAEVAVDAGNFDGMFLVMKCVSGWGTVEQAGESRRWEKGDILPVSMNRPTRFHFNGEFEQISLRPDRERLQALGLALPLHAVHARDDQQENEAQRHVDRIAGDGRERGVHFRLRRVGLHGIPAGEVARDAEG